MMSTHRTIKWGATLMVMSLAASLIPMATATHGDGPGPVTMTPPPVCERTLTAEAREDGSVFLDWEPAHEDFNKVTFYRVLRDGDTVAEVDETEFLDETAVPGETYFYQVQAHGHMAGHDDTTFTGCGSAEVTAIPFFGAPILGALAAVGAVGAYALIGRRRA